MNVIITDYDLLSSLGIRQLAAYLRSRGWKPAEHYFEMGRIWTAAEGHPRLVLPLYEEVDDYAASIASALATLARYEGRSQSLILRDIDAATKDIIRIRLSGNDAEDGAIPLDEAAHLIEHARDMMMAAACSAVLPKPVFTGRRPTEAVEYVKRVRMGQTERGSFVLTMQSEVPPQLADTESLSSSTEEPFSRRVTRTLAHSLWDTQTALADALTTGAMDRFFDAGDSRISANLCDAVAGLSLPGYDRDISIALSWSPTRPVPADVPSLVHFSSDRLPILREIARIWREKATYESFELKGFVVKLEHSKKNTGVVTVLGVVDGKDQRITVELQGGDHQLAIKAYENRVTFYVEGELEREGTSYRLKNPRAVAIEA
jgi:hypothetical protein